MGTHTAILYALKTGVFNEVRVDQIAILIYLECHLENVVGAPD